MLQKGDMVINYPTGFSIKQCPGYDDMIGYGEIFKIPPTAISSGFGSQSVSLSLFTGVMFFMILSINESF